jgi:TPR repeat protein
MLFRHLLAPLLTLAFLLPAQPALAGYKEGTAAYQKGDVAVALKEFMPLAKAGNADAQVMVAQIMINGGKGVPKNLKEGMEWVRRSAEGNNRDAQVFLAQALYNGNHGEQKDAAEAAKWFERAGKAGDQRAMLSFAQMQVYGIGVAAKPEAAVPWLETLAQAGNVTASGMLGTMAVQGNGMPKDHERAVKHLSAATRQGDAGSAFVLGQLYVKGLGVEANAEQGLQLITAAANAGNFQAMVNLAMLYANGQDGVTQDSALAYKWITIVLNRVQQGELFYAASGMEVQLRARMSNRQIEAAQAEASRFVVAPLRPVGAR